MTYTPDPARVRELATQLIMTAVQRRGDADDTLGQIVENDEFGLGDDGDAKWALLMAAVEAAAETALITIAFPA
jgi:hypothetical protein